MPHLQTVLTFSQTLLVLLSFVAATTYGAEGLSLDEILDLAYEHYEDVGITEYSVKAAELLADKALAAVLPTLSASGSLIRPEKSNYAGANVGSLKKGSVTLSQPLFSPAFSAAYASSKSSIKGTKENSLFQIKEILFKVTEVYFACLKGKELLAVEEQHLQLATLCL